jgi:CheY-like chemotaxis protein
MNPRAVNLNSVVEGIQSMLNRLIGEQYEITTTLDQKIQIVKADSGNIEQVLLNLIVNARDAMPDGGRIIVGTQNLELEAPVADMSGMEHMGEYTCLWVQDAGEGMDDTVRSKIFEPFFSTKSVSTGTGLGLSVVYGIVEQHNGWVEVESQPGVGSTFRIYLPVMSEDASIAADPTAVIQEDLHGRGEKVLLVEDEEVVRNLAMKMLAGSGFEVAAAADAREAIELFNRSGGDFQLLFCDVVLPGVTGVRLADDLRKDNPDLQVLLVSGYTGDVIDHAEIIKKGYRFLQKPYSLADLLIEINNLLHNKGQ